MSDKESSLATGQVPWFARQPLPPLDQIQSAHTRYVRSLLGRFRVNPAHSREDLAQEILLRAHRSRDSRLDVRALLYGISRHVVLRWRVKRRMEGEVLALMERRQLVTDRTAEDDWQERERREAVSAAVAELPEIHRDVFLLIQVEDWTMPEVAKHLGVSVNTGYTRLRAAQVTFRRCLDRVLARRGMKRKKLP